MSRQGERRVYAVDEALFVLLTVVRRRSIGDGISSIVDRRRLQDDAERADCASGREDPQEQTVEDERYVLPVLLDLQPTTNRSMENNRSSVLARFRPDNSHVPLSTRCQLYHLGQCQPLSLPPLQNDF